MCRPAAVRERERKLRVQERFYFLSGHSRSMPPRPAVARSQESLTAVVASTTRPDAAVGLRPEVRTAPHLPPGRVRTDSARACAYRAGESRGNYDLSAAFRTTGTAARATFSTRVMPSW